MNNGLSFVSSSVTIKAVACVSMHVELQSPRSFRHQHANDHRHLTPEELRNGPSVRGVTFISPFVVRRDLRGHRAAHPDAPAHPRPAVVVLAPLLHRGTAAILAPLRVKIMLWRKLL